MFSIDKNTPSTGISGEADDTLRCYPAIGWEPGQYEVGVFIEGRRQNVAEFEVVKEGEEE